jgi:hypothetical protein
MPVNEVYEALNPKGIQLPVQLFPLTPRLPDLKNKTIYFVDLGKPASDTAFDALEKYLSETIPEAKFVRRQKKLTYFADEPDLWNEIIEKADAFIFGIYD